MDFRPVVDDTGLPLPAAGCTAHLETARRRWTVPCVCPTTVPTGRFRVWLENDTHISPSPETVDRIPRSRRLTLPLVPAGRVVVTPAADAPGAVARLLHLESHNRGQQPRAEMLREVELTAPATRLPAGRFVALLYDPEKRDYLAFGGPASARAGSTVEVSPRPPSQTDLLVVLERPEAATTFEQYDVTPVLLSEHWNDPQLPDLAVPAAERTYALWRDLPGSRATLEVRSPSVYLEPREVVLRPRRLEHLELALLPRPALDVVLDLPEELRGDELALEVLELPARATVRRVELEPTARELRLEGMPPAKLVAVLESPPWKLRQAIDLGDGTDGFVTFAPEPILLTGRVYRGDEPHAGSIVLHPNLDPAKGELAIDAGDDGHYQAVLFRPGTYTATVQVGGTGGPPLLDLLEVPDAAAFEHDFTVPDLAVEVRVVDAVTGAGIGGARVSFHLRGDGITSAQTTETDAEGRVRLANLRQGPLTLSAFAEGYQPYRGEPLEMNDDLAASEVKLALDPIGETVALRLFLPGGAPAASAEALFHASPADARQSWSGRADAQGRIRVPRHLDGALLLVRHPLAASAARIFDLPADPSRAVEWHLAAPAPEPLTIVAKDRWGEPAGWTELLLWLGGRRVNGPALRWLTHSTSSTTDANGFWQGSHLPPAPTRVLGWTRSQRHPALAGELDGFAVAVPYPWSRTVELTIVE